MSEKARTRRCHASPSVWITLVVVAVLVALSPTFFDRIWGRHR
ncbi:hypothetical protein [Propionicicella superfundia]|nr:hypothetical protein [Propionicicella superfundia]